MCPQDFILQLAFFHQVTSPPDDSVSCVKFSPGVLPSTFLIASSWDNKVVIVVAMLDSQVKIINALNSFKTCCSV